MSKRKRSVLSTFFLRMLLALFILLLFSTLPMATVPGTAVHPAAPSVIPSATPSVSSQQYLVLGDSLAFGFQPNQNFTHGYAIDLFQTLQAKQHFGDLTNLGCPGETSTTFIEGNTSCPAAQMASSSQLSAALTYLDHNADTTGLITLHIGANDVLPAIDPTTCTVQTALFNTHLATLDQNLTQTILPQLHNALKNGHAHHTSLILVKYYNPFQPSCPTSSPLIQTLNEHLEQDARGYANTVDIFNSFDQTNAQVCLLTWICSVFRDIHPNTQGYQVIADAIFQQVLAHDYE